MLFILNRDEEITGIFSNNGSPETCPYKDDNLIEDLETGVSSYEFTIPSNHVKADLVQEGGYIVRNDLDNELVMFNILSIEESHSSANDKVIYAENAGLELLNDHVRPISYLSKNAEQILTLVLAGTRWEPGEVDYFGVDNYYFEGYENVVATLQAIKSKLKGELRFRVVMKNGAITKRYVDLVERRGVDTKKRFSYSKDITEIRRRIDTSELVTALIGVGAGDDNEVFTTFTTIGKYIDNGDPYSKPSNQDWVGDPDALERFGRQGKHLTGKFEYDTKDPEILLTKTWEELQRRKNPSITYELEVALLERIANLEHEKTRLGDTVYVIDETFSPALYLEARILKLETCFCDPSKDKCTLGNYKIAKSNITKQMRDLQTKLLQKAPIWDASKFIHSGSPPEDLDAVWVDTSGKTNSIKTYNKDTGTWEKATITDFVDLAGQVSTMQIADNAVEAAKIADNAVGTEKIQPDAITNEKLANSAVKSENIVDESILTTKLAEFAITTGKLAPNAVDTSKIVDNAITNTKVSINAIDNSKIVDEAITNAKIAENAITKRNLAPGSVGVDEIETGAITEEKTKWSSHLIF